MYMGCKVVSNKKQLARLVELMEQNTDLAKGICPKPDVPLKWNVIATELNSLGPPERPWHKWQRVWVDLKCKKKKKSTEQYKSGNKSHISSDLEETVMKILSEDTSSKEVELNENTFEDISIKSETEITDTTHPDPGEKLDNEHQNESRPSRSEELQENCKFLLQTQIADQQKFHKNMIRTMEVIKNSIQNIEYITKKNYAERKDHSDEILKIKKEKLKLYKENIEKTERYRNAKLKLQLEILKIKRQDFDDEM